MARTITEPLLEASARGPIAELGAGEGRFQRRLRELGLNCWSLDRRYPPALPELNAIAADVLHLPFANGSLSALVLANLLRQIDPPARPRLVTECSRVMREGACLVVLEDDPAARDEAERNYRRCLEVLGQLVPGRGRGMVGAEECDQAFAPVLGTPRGAGLEENEESIHDPLAPLRWMESVGFPPARQATLARQIHSHGMRYGRYWYRVFWR